MLNQRKLRWEVKLLQRACGEDFMLSGNMAGITVLLELKGLIPTLKFSYKSHN